MKKKTKKKQTVSNRNKDSITKVPEQIQAEITVTCKSHHLAMKRVGRSERGLPLYFCKEGCMAEVGIGRVKRFR